MKKIFLTTTILAGVILFLASGCGKDRLADDFVSLQEAFVAPSKEYGTAPLYVWNTTITPDLIDRTMTDLKDKGFSGVFVHPRPGLITEYVSDEWYKMFRYTVDKGKELDMNVWIYDENSYPSGFAGGHVPAQMPESFNQGQGLVQLKSDTLPGAASEYFLFLKEENGVFVDITQNLSSETGKKGNYYLYSKTYERKSPWYAGFSYVDLLYPGVTEKFMEVTLPGYEQVAGDEFGKSVPGWFTDEPNIHTTGGIRWTPCIFDIFLQRWGYDLKKHLPSLFEETGDWKTVRHNYQQTLLQLFIDRWAKPCFEYCEENNLKFTGHYWEHGWPDVGHGPDNMAMYAWHQQPAIDMLFNQFDEVSPQAQFGNIRAVKELRSVANQMGYRRTLSETYGGGGWEETFRDFKRLGDWEYALGVNFMNQCQSHLSIAGARKYDYPPGFSAHSPWWKYYRPLNMHFVRLSMALSSGEQINDMLILEPTTSIWLYYAYSKSHPAFRKTGQTFQTFITALEKAQVEYDLGSENVIKDHGKVNKGKFVVGKRAYSKVVIPPAMENLDAATFMLLKKFVDRGGIILAFSRPDRLEGKKDADVEKFFSDNQQITYIPELTQDVIGQHFSSPNIAFSEVRGGNPYHHRRIMNDGQILFLVNSSLDEYASGKIRTGGKDVVELNTLNGKIADYPEYPEGKNVYFDFRLPPAGSLLLYIFDKKQTGFAQPDAVRQYVAVETASPLTVTPESSNVLSIDFCDLETGGKIFRDLHVYDACEKAFKTHGFENGNPWNTSVQYKDNTVSRDTFSTGGFQAIYKFDVVGNFDRSSMQAVVERSQLYRILLNGKEVSPASGKWWLDRDMHVIPCGEHVKTGTNSLTLQLSPMKIHAEIEPVYILGNFTVHPAAKGWTIEAPQNSFGTGSWKEQGMPFYPGTVSYIRHYELSDSSAPYRVVLNGWNGTVAEIVVNGMSAGIIGFEPYTLDVSGLLKKGDNEIQVKIVGSNKNLLGPFHNRPNKGLVSPWNFRNVKNYPPGKEYQQLDYGLTDDFRLEKGR